MAKKTTEKDKAIMSRLDKALNLNLDHRKHDFKRISNAKQDTKNLTVTQCLRKDLKVRIGES